MDHRPRLALRLVEALHGPIIDAVPSLDESLAIWDATVPLLRSKVFFELKRGRG
ncbi:hypothetical protein ACFQS1_20435 [Paractinoplanes rhizophilus]|uniref:Uncharacterized protein n=1 Tax=Paractinoplanes rhizophilus TaxID=1416877 RepID=A0ABW2HT72_9ACTN|nr:hypothetical protein [Actinoplanes sp.]